MWKPSVINDRFTSNPFAKKEKARVNSSSKGGEGALYNPQVLQWTTYVNMYMHIRWTGHQMISSDPLMTLSDFKRKGSGNLIFKVFGAFSSLCQPPPSTIKMMHAFDPATPKSLKMSYSMLQSKFWWIVCWFYAFVLSLKVIKARRGHWRPGQLKLHIFHCKTF